MSGDCELVRRQPGDEPTPEASPHADALRWKYGVLWSPVPPPLPPPENGEEGADEEAEERPSRGGVKV